MTSISALASHVGEVVQGLYELHDPEWRNTRQGLPFFSASLQDHTGQLRVYGWPPEFQASAFAPRQWTLCHLRPRWRTDGLVADVLTCRPWAGPLPHPLRHGTPGQPPVSQLAGRLHLFVTQCPIPALRGMALT